MPVLALVGLVAGVITSLSPCVLPVLPVVLTASVPSHTGVGSHSDVDDARDRVRSWRPYGVVAGLVLSFSVATLFGSLLLSALHLPADLLRTVGIVVLVVIGVSFVWRHFGELLERPFARLSGRQVNPDSNGLILGMGLGLLYAPCAGPVLAVISGQSHVHVSVDGRPDSSAAVNGPPTLYTLLEQSQNQRMTIRLTPEPGVQAYSFTFD